MNKKPVHLIDTGGYKLTRDIGTKEAELDDYVVEKSSLGGLKPDVILPFAFDEDEASRLLAEHDLKVDITLYEGDAYDRMFTCDFSYDYVKINGSYRT